MEEKRIHLTSGEIGSLWTSYMNDSMSTTILKFMLKDISDPEIKTVLQSALDISTLHLKKLSHIFNKEEFAIPNGFTENDVDMDAPWLFTDVFCLSYVSHMARVGMISYSGFLSMSSRVDIRDYYTDCLHETSKLFNQAIEIALSKGVNPRHPYIKVPKKSDYIGSKEYLSGINPFSEKRPLNSIEISHLYFNTLTNSIGIRLCLAFAQTSPNKEVQEYLIRAKDVAKKHTKIFSDTLLKDNIETPRLPDVGVSDSTTQTFSDKFIMFHMSLLMSSGVGNYATAGGVSQRLDVAVNYERLSLEIAKLAKTGADIMIKYSWLEEPPGVKDRDKLARNKT
ncbi:DUF3231 family protein [Ornithinibacillus sp. L9]|uniref:DUF3231 family protein n=1 Tax=Ornithinibacillus caprae TaxID=2678566 RepID=A0A6N8FLT6_9BACI|nr:DUF3231 family protein [Ornithinibacillus caprae]MUK88278.1 DUF3231 family protein [Ornithinibacillus caprae]